MPQLLPRACLPRIDSVRTLNRTMCTLEYYGHNLRGNPPASCTGPYVKTSCPTSTDNLKWLNSSMSFDLNYTAERDSFIVAKIPYERNNLTNGLSIFDHGCPPTVTQRTVLEGSYPWMTRFHMRTKMDVQFCRYLSILIHRSTSTYLYHMVPSISEMGNDRIEVPEESNLSF